MVVQSVFFLTEDDQISPKRPSDGILSDNAGQKKTPAMLLHRMFFPVVYKILSSPKKTPGEGAALDVYKRQVIW